MRIRRSVPALVPVVILACSVGCSKEKTAEVFQLSAGGEAGSESFPSAFLRAEVSAGTFAELVGKTLKGELYVQTQADGPVWHSPDGQPVEIAITQAADASVEGQLVRGTLISSETGESVSVTGKFQAAVR